MTFFLYNIINTKYLNKNSKNNKYIYLFHILLKKKNGKF